MCMLWNDAYIETFDTDIKPHIFAKSDQFIAVKVFQWAWIDWDQVKAFIGKRVWLLAAVTLLAPVHIGKTKIYHFVSLTLFSHFASCSVMTFQLKIEILFQNSFLYKANLGISHLAIFSQFLSGQTHRIWMIEMPDRTVLSINVLSIDQLFHRSIATATLFYQEKICSILPLHLNTFNVCEMFVILNILLEILPRCKNEDFSNTRFQLQQIYRSELMNSTLSKCQKNKENLFWKGNKCLTESRKIQRAWNLEHFIIGQQNCCFS